MSGITPEVEKSHAERNHNVNVCINYLLFVKDKRTVCLKLPESKDTPWIYAMDEIIRKHLASVSE